jgi:hypothetical protein
MYIEWFVLPMGFFVRKTDVLLTCLPRKKNKISLSV